MSRQINLIDDIVCTAKEMLIQIATKAVLESLEIDIRISKERTIIRDEKNNCNIYLYPNNDTYVSDIYKFQEFYNDFMNFKGEKKDENW